MPDEFTITSPSLGRLVAQFNRAPVIIREEQRKGVDAAGAVGLREVRDRTPIRSGRSRASIVFKVEQSTGPEIRGSLTVIRMPGQPEHLIEWLEGGTRPHVIEARFRKTLRFSVAGRVVWPVRVMHPGTRKYAMFARGLAAAQPRIARIFAAHLGNVTRRLRQ